MKWFIKCLTQYADFNGRARRKEYWMFVLFNAIISFVIGFIFGLIEGFTGITGISYISYIYSLFILIPSLAVCVRRLHDIGKSGWMLLLILIPIIGSIWLLILYVKDSQPGVNKYGPNPKE